jgi:hypothetical protein
MDLEKKQKQIDYELVRLDLREGRSNEKVTLPFAPVRLIVWDLDGTLEIRINRPDSPLLPLHVGDVLEFAPGASERLWNLYITNTAQASEKATLVLCTGPLRLSRGV